MTRVQTSHGELEGELLPSGTSLFAGIPFAAPPVGELRFRPPQPPSSWSGVRASAFPPAPVQPTPGLPQSEDCLYLNVWTPSSTGPHPVLLWVYGGGFEGGSASPPATDGRLLAERLDAVVVAPSYRVGVLGFAHLSDRGVQGGTNVGLQDVVAALQWVRDNIDAFGGDPARVTAGGVSAGAFIVGALLAVPAAEGLFQRAVLHSGSTGRIFPSSLAHAIAGDLLAALDVPVEGLGAVTVDRLLEVQPTVIARDIGQRNLPGGRSWGIVLDGAVLPRDPQEVVASGGAAGVDLLVCATREEIQMFALVQAATFPPADEQALIGEMAKVGVGSGTELLNAYRTRHPGEDLTQLRTRFLSDAIYRLPATRLAAAQVAAGGRAWSSLQSAAPFGPALAACHASDMPFAFEGTSLAAVLPAATIDLAPVRDQMMRAWRGFLHDGDPGWPMYAAGAATTFEYGSGQLIAEPPLDDVSALWSTVD